jgi:LemA protein
MSALVFLVFAAGVLIYGAMLYRGLSRMRDANDQAWAALCALLTGHQSKAANLIEISRAYLADEYFAPVTNAMQASTNAASKAEKAAAHRQLSSAVHGFSAIAAENPQLRSNREFVALQTEIAEVNQHIAERSKSFNENVREYNSRIGQIPDVFVASSMGLTRREMFLLSESDSRTVE